MTYRILPPEEWPRLAPIVTGYEQYLPSPEAAMCAVAESELGEIEGALFFQVVMHMEPLILKTPHASFLRLQQTIEGALADRKGLPYYSFSNSEIVEKMAAKAGMTKTPFTAVWIKAVP